MENLSKQSKLARFTLALPPTKTEEGEIPESIMCQTLRNNLNQIEDIREMKQENNVIICEKIILAFESLYNKYIDSQNAVFMINISSNNRNQLTHLFDKNYYKMMIKRQTTNERKIIGIAQQDNNKDMSFIKSMVKSHCDDIDLIQTILREIIVATESSVLEIAALMNDSFTRFKIDNRQFVRTLSGSIVGASSPQEN